MSDEEVEFGDDDPEDGVDASDEESTESENAE